jgi:Tol biopolymer transport system component
MTTEESKLTGEGTIVGTFQYMAPERLEGKEADARTDIFALGEVMYEMATGKPAFSGKNRATLIAAILTTDPPPITQLQPMTPPALERVVKRCLAKDPDERWQTATDLASELTWIATLPQSGSSPAITIKPSKRLHVLWSVAALVLAALAMAAGRVYFHSPGISLLRARWIIAPPDKSTFHAYGDAGGPVVVSPDGQHLAFAAVDANGKQQLWVRPLDSLNANLLPDTEGAYYPFWSPDGQYLGFFSNGQLKRVSTNGGAVVSLCSVVNARGGSWNQQGVIVFAPEYRGGLYRVPATGGTPEPVTQLDPKNDSHRWPFFLPDGEHFLYLAFSHDSVSHANEGIYVGSLDGKESKFLLRTRANAAYASGQLLYLNESTLMAQPFDLRRLTLAGEPAAVEEGVESELGWGLGVFSTSQNGVLAHAPAGAGDQLTLFSPSGKQLDTVGDIGRYQSLRLSPDGLFLAVEHERPSHHLWIYDLKNNLKSQFTFGSSANAVPVWSPDGKEIVFASDRKGHTDLYRKSVSSPGGERVLLESTNNKFPLSWSPDGKFLLYSESDQFYRATLWLLPLDGSGAPRVLLTDDFYSTDGYFSPDGHWIAYTSREQGTNQIFVAAFPGPGIKRQVSFTGGANPVWRSDGKALFYSDDNAVLREAVVSWRNADLSIGSATALFLPNSETVSGQGRTYDVAPDGRFIVNARGHENETQIVVVSDWAAKLKK